MPISIQIPADIAQLNRRWTKDFARDYGVAAKRTGSVRMAFLEACEKHGIELGDAFKSELENWKDAEAAGLKLQPPETLTSGFQARMFLESQGFSWTEYDDIPF